MNPHIWHENHKQNDIRNDRQVKTKNYQREKGRVQLFPFISTGFKIFLKDTFC